VSSREFSQWSSHREPGGSTTEQASITHRPMEVCVVGSGGECNDKLGAIDREPNPEW
jgi:hypothetical protein